MGKLLIVLFVLAALQLAWAVHNEGFANAYGGVFAPLVGQSAARSQPRQVARKPPAQTQSQALRRTGRPSQGSVAHGMRDRVNAAMGNRPRNTDD